MSPLTLFVCWCNYCSNIISASLRHVFSPSLVLVSIAKIFQVNLQFLLLFLSLCISFDNYVAILINFFVFWLTAECCFVSSYSFFTMICAQSCVSLVSFSVSIFIRISHFLFCIFYLSEDKYLYLCSYMLNNVFRWLYFHIIAVMLYDTCYNCHTGTTKLNTDFVN